MAVMEHLVTNLPLVIVVLVLRYHVSEGKGQESCNRIH
mgnify:CR=1 FL=1